MIVVSTETLTDLFGSHGLGFGMMGRTMSRHDSDCGFFLYGSLRQRLREDFCYQRS